MIFEFFVIYTFLVNILFYYLFFRKDVPGIFTFIPTIILVIIYITYKIQGRED